MLPAASVRGKNQSYKDAFVLFTEGEIGVSNGDEMLKGRVVAGKEKGRS